MKTTADISAELQGCDGKNMSVEQVTAFLRQLVDSTQLQLATEPVPLMQALGRVVAHDVISPFNVPPHDNSAMDGYAFAHGGAHAPHNGAEAIGGKITLRVVGTALAGQAWQGEVGNGECIKIMTGAVMPQGLDTVVPQEFTSPSPPSALSPPAGASIEFPGTLLRAGDNRRLAGEDIAMGSVALAAGSTIGPAALGLLASLGLPEVAVRRRLKVAYFSTGDEVLSVGEAPREGAIFDSNRYVAFGLLRRMGIDVLDLGVVKDQPQALRTAFQTAAAAADAVITSGGVSVGEADHTKAMMAELGDVAFWRVAMRPGRPMAVGRIGHNMDATATYTANKRPALLFGLPGNPVAVMVTFLAFVRPALQRLMGANDAPLPLLKAASTEPLRKKPGRTEYQRAIVQTNAQGQLTVQTTGNQGSGVLSSMVQANGLIVLHHQQGNVAAGEWVDVMMFEGVI